MALNKLNVIKLSDKPEVFKSLIYKCGKAVVEVDNLASDYTLTCNLGDRLLAEPGRPQISTSKRYIIGIGDRLIYSRVMQKKKKNIIYILGIGEVAIGDIVFWCNAKKYKPAKNSQR